MRFCDEKRFRHGYFYKWCNYSVTPEGENLERLAVELDATPEWFLFGPIIFERNRPLAPAPARGAGRGARPTLSAPSRNRRRPTTRGAGTSSQAPPEGPVCRIMLKHIWWLPRAA